MSWILCGDIKNKALVALTSKGMKIFFFFRNPHEMDPTKNPDGEEMSANMISFMQQRLQLGM